MADECSGCGEKFDEATGVMQSLADDGYCIECQEFMEAEDQQRDFEVAASIEANSYRAGDLDFEGVGDDGED